MTGEDLLAADALARLVPRLERCVEEDWRSADDRQRFVEMLVMIRDGLPNVTAELVEDEAD